MATLITGLGYIGSALAARLLADRKSVVGVESFFSTDREALAPLEAANRFRLVEGSVTDPDTLERAFSELPIDTVYHTSGQATTDPRVASLEHTLTTNVVGALRVLEACAAHNVPRFVLASSTRLYATPLPRRVSERSPIHAPDAVHGSQLLSETLLETVQRQAPDWRVHAVAARLGTVHGTSPVMKTDARFLAVPHRFCWQAARGETLQVSTGPSTLLALIDVQDAVDGLIACAEQPGAPAVVNLAREVVSVFEIARVVEYLGALRGLGVRMDVQGPEPRLDGHTITSALAARGFAPQIDLAHSLGPVLDHYLRVSAGESAP